MKSSEFLYEVGDIIKTKNGEIEILQKFRNKLDNNKKSYTYKCLVDKGEYTINEYNLNLGKGCPVCANKKVIKGINDISTTNKKLSNYFLNKEESYLYTETSGKKVDMICPECNRIKKYRIATVKDCGFSCDFCSDGISYGEKIINNLLSSLNLKFETQYTSSWCVGKKYDVYIEHLNCILEVHGLQHYEDGKFTMNGARTLVEEQENDRFKKELALSNGIEHYIELDCRYSTLKWIKKSILNSKLGELIDISNIDWDGINKKSLSSNIIKSCNMYNDGLNVKEISSQLHCSDDVVRKWLNKCKANNMCDFDGKFNSNNGNSKKVKNSKSGYVYNSISEASRLTNIGRKILSQMCNDINNNEWILI